MVEILKDLEIVDLALKYKDNLIFGDLHIGFEEAYIKRGVMMPYFQYESIINKIKKIIDEIKPRRIIINGDLKHEFGTISRQEWKDTLRLLDFLLEEDREVILIRGNHDTILGPIAKRKKIKILDRYDIDDISIVHGHQEIKKLKKTVIIGHLHPAISFKEKTCEKYKCFLQGKYKKHDLIIMPAVTLVGTGYDVTKNNITKDNPYAPSLKNFEVYVVQDKVYKFGKLKNLI